MANLKTFLLVLSCIIAITLSQTTTAEPETTAAEETTAEPETTVAETTAEPETTNVDTTLSETTADITTTEMVTTEDSTVINGPDCNCMPGKTNCQGKSIILMLIKKLFCGAAGSCLNTKFKILEIFADPVEFECEPSSFNWGQIVAKNMKSMKCKKEGCKGSKFEIEGSANDGCQMECDGEGSCRDTEVDIETPKEVKCDGMTSCMGSKFKLKKPKDGKCKVECKENYSCKESSFKVSVTQITILEFVIEGQQSGEDSTIEIENNSTSSSVFIELYIICKKPKACKNLKLIIPSSIIVMNSDKLECESESCEDVTENGAPAAFKLITSETENPGTLTGGHIAIIIISSIVAVLIAVFIILYLLKKRKTKPNHGSSPVKTTDSVDEHSISNNKADAEIQDNAGADNIELINNDGKTNNVNV